jgi:hypothetical protein
MLFGKRQRIEELENKNQQLSSQLSDAQQLVEATRQ